MLVFMDGDVDDFWAVVVDFEFAVDGPFILQFPLFDLAMICFFIVPDLKSEISLFFLFMKGVCIVGVNCKGGPINGYFGD